MKDNTQKRLCSNCGREIKTGRSAFGNFEYTIKCQCQIEKEEKERQAMLKKGYEMIKAKIFSDNGISPKYSGATLDKITLVKGQENACIKAKEFLNDYLKSTKTKGFAFFGAVGSGKTYIVAALINQLCNNIVDKTTEKEREDICAGRLSVVSPAVFISNIELIEKVKNDNELINKYKKSKLLIIDDLGAARNTEWAEERLFEIIDYRYCQELPIIFTTNITPKDLKEKISNRIFDRLVEMCDFISVTAPSQRSNAAKNNKVS